MHGSDRIAAHINGTVKRHRQGSRTSYQLTQQWLVHLPIGRQDSQDEPMNP